MSYFTNWIIANIWGILQYSRSNFSEGKDLGTLETPLIFMHCQAYLKFREDSNPEEDVKDRQSYLKQVNVKRKELESNLSI